MPRPLKVFRTPIGFHDAYVAAPSQKAALAAWDADANLFARGVAEEVTDPALTEEPLAHPGEVIRRVRGSVAEHLAALPPTPAAKPRRQARDAPRPAERRPPPTPKPKPDRDALDAAEAAIEAAQARFADARRDIEAREAALLRERRQLDRDRERELGRLEKDRDAADAAYRQALTAWREDRP